MLGNIGIAEGFIVVILMVVAWLVPIAIAVWFMRTLSAMAVAQREIAARLASMDEHLRGSTGGA